MKTQKELEDELLRLKGEIVGARSVIGLLLGMTSGVIGPVAVHAITRKISDFDIIFINRITIDDRYYSVST